jgi:hypothetical protein
MGSSRTTRRRALALVMTVHGLIHLLGVWKGFGWAEVATLTEPIGPALGVAWLAAAALVLGAAALVLRDARHWPEVAVVAALASQLVVLTSWTDAAAGSAANAIMVLAAGLALARRRGSDRRVPAGAAR